MEPHLPIHLWQLGNKRLRTACGGRRRDVVLRHQWISYHLSAAERATTESHSEHTEVLHAPHPTHLANLLPLLACRPAGHRHVERQQHLVLLLLHCQHPIHPRCRHLAHSSLLEYRRRGTILPLLAVDGETDPRSHRPLASPCRHSMSWMASLQMGTLPVERDLHRLSVLRCHTIRLHDAGCHRSRTLPPPQPNPAPHRRQQSPRAALSVGARLLTTVGKPRACTRQATASRPAFTHMHCKPTGATHNQP